MFKQVFVRLHLLCLYPLVVQVLQFPVASGLLLGLLFAWL